LPDTDLPLSGGSANYNSGNATKVLTGSWRRPHLALDRFFAPAPKVVSVHVFAALRRVIFDDQHSV
jgi:hypothetical protein